MLFRSKDSAGLLDSGCPLTLLDVKHFPTRLFGGVTHYKAEHSIPAANGSPVHVKASFMGTISVLHKTARVHVLLCESLFAPAILGMSAFHALRNISVGDADGINAIFIDGKPFTSCPEFVLVSETPVNPIHMQTELISRATFSLANPLEGYSLILEDDYVPIAETAIAQRIATAHFPREGVWEIEDLDSYAHGQVNGNAAAMCAALEKPQISNEANLPDRKSTRLNSSHITRSRMPSSA